MACEGVRDDTSRMAQSTSGFSLLIFPRGNDQVEPFQPLTRMHYNNFSLASLWRREIPFPNSRQGGCLQELELVFYISRNPQIPPHDCRCTATTRDNGRIYIWRICEVIRMEDDVDFVP